MSYNSDLQQNNAELVQILASVNALPDAGGELELPELTNPGTSADLLRSKQLIDGDGNIVSGTMMNWAGGINAYLSRDSESYTIPSGYHNGSGKVNVNVETLEVTPSKIEHTYLAPVGSSTTPSASKLYGSVKVKAIPDQYQDVTPVTATAEDVAAGKVFVDATGAVVTGTAEVGGGSSGELTGIFFYDENLTEGRMTKCKVNGVTAIANYTAYTNAVLDEIEINLYSNPQTGSYISSTAFYNCPRVTKITFKSKVDNIHNRAFYNVGTAQACVVNVPWAEGEVAAAPWGLTTATINYNYTGE
jgi:hypothetical protein